jgi:hypothetical protein
LCHDTPPHSRIHISVVSTLSFALGNHLSGRGQALNRVLFSMLSLRYLPGHPIARMRRVGRSRHHEIECRRVQPPALRDW